MAISGVILPDGQECDSAELMEEALHKSWEHTFSEKPVATTGLDKYLAHELVFEDIPPPTFQAAIRVLLTLAGCSEGPCPDGLRYLFWAVCLQYSAELCCSLAVSLPDFIEDLPYLIDSTMILRPKKPMPDEDLLVLTPRETRPLNLKNNDNKVHSSLLYFRLAPAVAAKAHSA